MIVLKTSRELKLMQESCKIAARALQLAGEAVEPGITTAAIDKLVSEFITKSGAVSSTLGYNGYPASTCISINQQVIHGIPSPRTVIQPGDIVSIDISAKYNGYHSDNAATFAAGTISQEAQQLCDATRESLFEGIRAARLGARIGDISAAIQQYVQAHGYSVVRDFTGHGVGAHLHEDPSVPNFGMPGRGVRLMEGMTLAVEPMVNQGSFPIKVLSDGWTVVTADGKLSAHFEHTIAITQSGPVIMTLL